MARKFRFLRSRSRPGGRDVPMFTVQVRPSVGAVLEREMAEDYERKIFEAETDGELRSIVDAVVNDPYATDYTKQYLLSITDKRYGELREMR